MRDEGGRRQEAGSRRFYKLFLDSYFLPPASCLLHPSSLIPQFRAVMAFARLICISLNSWLAAANLSIKNST
jgi:hypothetical protein